MSIGKRLRRSRSASVRNPIGIRQHLVSKNGLARVGARFRPSLGGAGNETDLALFTIQTHAGLTGEVRHSSTGGTAWMLILFWSPVAVIFDLAGQCSRVA